MEINEYRNYERAIDIYSEAIGIVDKLDDENKRNAKIEELKNKIKITNLFTNLNNLANESKDEALGICNQMLNIVTL